MKEEKITETITSLSRRFNAWIEDGGSTYIGDIEDWWLNRVREELEELSPKGYADKPLY